MTFLAGSCAIVLSLLAGSPPSSQAATSQPGGGEPKPRLAVLDFNIEGKVEASGSKSLAAIVRDEFHRSGQYDLMDRDMMRERMGEKDWAASVECDEIKCLVKCGTSLDVQKIVGGLATSFGKKWVLTIRLVDVNTGREEKLFTREHDGDVSDLLGIAREGASELFGSGPPLNISVNADPTSGPAPLLVQLHCAGAPTDASVRWMLNDQQIAEGDSPKVTLKDVGSWSIACRVVAKDGRRAERRVAVTVAKSISLPDDSEERFRKAIQKAKDALDKMERKS